MIDNQFLEIKNYTGEGYRPLVDFGAWRVAFLRFIDELLPENITFVERHVETDEVFVLLSGRAVLFIGEGEDSIEQLHALEMEPGQLYNVKCNAWHTCVLSRGATILLVENCDTGSGNTNYMDLTADQRDFLRDKTRSVF